jgi:hypothetical protein
MLIYGHYSKLSIELSDFNTLFQFYILHYKAQVAATTLLPTTTTTRTTTTTKTTVVTTATIKGCGNPVIKPFVPESRIVGGLPAIPHSFPWQIYMQKNGKFFCGGSIINDYWILTATHCIQ